MVKMVRSGKGAQRRRRQQRHRPINGTQARAFFIVEGSGCLPFIFAGRPRASAVVAGLQGDPELPARHFHTAM